MAIIISMIGILITTLLTVILIIKRIKKQPRKGLAILFNIVLLITMFSFMKIPTEEKQVEVIEESEIEYEDNEWFINEIDNLMEESKGSILYIQSDKKEGWDNTSIIVDDVWYDLKEHEKERFAESVAGRMKDILSRIGKLDQDNKTYIYFYDINKKMLATPKTSGEYRIER